MPKTDWQRPTYEGHEIFEMESLWVPPHHPDEMVRQWHQHVLMLTRCLLPTGGECWGMVWLARNNADPWHQVLRTDSPGPGNGEAELKIIRDCRERITGRVSR